MQIGNFFQELEDYKNERYTVHQDELRSFGCSCNSHGCQSNKRTMPQVVIFAQKAETGYIQNILLPFATSQCTILGPPPRNYRFPSRSCYRIFYKMSFADFYEIS